MCQNVTAILAQKFLDFCPKPGLSVDKISIQKMEPETMAKTTTIKIKLLSTADTGFFYVTKKNPRTKTEKLEFRKYDPVVRKHVIFKETKIK